MGGWQITLTVWILIQTVVKMWMIPPLYKQLAIPNGGRNGAMVGTFLWGATTIFILYMAGFYS